MNGIIGIEHARYHLYVYPLSILKIQIVWESPTAPYALSSLLEQLIPNSFVTHCPTQQNFLLPNQCQIACITTGAILILRFQRKIEV